MMITGKPIRLLVFEDNDDMRESLCILFSNVPGITFTGAFPDAIEAIDNVIATEPDVILMDIDMPRVSGIETVWRIREQFPNVRVLMLTVFDDEQKVFQSVCVGASGYILKRTPPAKIIEAVFEVADGGGPLTASIARKVLDMFPHYNASKTETGTLTKREREVLALLVKGHSYKMVAAGMDIAVETVRSHIKNIYEKLHVHSSGEAIALAIRNRLV